MELCPIEFTMFQIYIFIKIQLEILNCAYKLGLESFNNDNVS